MSSGLDTLHSCSLTWVLNLLLLNKMGDLVEILGLSLHVPANMVAVPMVKKIKHTRERRESHRWEMGCQAHNLFQQISTTASPQWKHRYMHSRAW